MSVEDDFRTELHARLDEPLSRVQPSGDLLDRLRRRSRRRTRRLQVTAACAVVLAGSSTYAVVQVSAHERPSGAGFSPARTWPLISTGPCAGLAVSVEVPGQQQRWPVTPGATSLVAPMVGTTLRYLRATGPCVPQLRWQLTGDSVDGLGADRGAGGFVDNVAAFVSKSTGPTRVALYLDPSHPLATVTFDVTAGSPSPTEQPTAAPSAEAVRSARAAVEARRGRESPEAVVRQFLLAEASGDIAGERAELSPAYAAALASTNDSWLMHPLALRDIAVGKAQTVSGETRVPVTFRLDAAAGGFPAGVSLWSFTVVRDPSRGWLIDSQGMG